MISILFYIKIREHKLLEISKSKCVFLESESVESWIFILFSTTISGIMVPILIVYYIIYWHDNIGTKKYSVSRYQIHIPKEHTLDPEIPNNSNCKDQ